MNKALGEEIGPDMKYDPIAVEIMWSRLIAIVDQASKALVRSAFSTIVTEGNDYACVLMDDEGNSLAESTASIPCFNATLPETMKHFLRKYPKENWKPGDYVVTNDPWMGTGHLPDFTMATPIFVKGKLVAFAGTIAHASDVGGTTFGADTTDIFQEGLKVPIMKIVKEGHINEDLVDIIKANVRVPDKSMGDLYAQITAGEVLAAGLLDLMEEQKIEDLSSIAAITKNLAEEAMRKAIKRIPEGIYTHSIETDGFDEPFIIKATIIVKDGGITVDYAGTSPQTDKGSVNSPMCYTYAYTAYPIKCAIDPETPKNEGSYRPIKVVAPFGTIVNAVFPAAVNARYLTGHFLSTVIYGALAQVIPDKIIAESGGTPNFRGRYFGIGRDGKMFSQGQLGAGGMGARPNRDGLACTCFPSNSLFGSVEISESVAPLIFWEKEIVKDSGGPGKHRGGCGQRMVVQLVSEHPAIASFLVDRIRHPALGLLGGMPGSRSELWLYKGEPGHPVNLDEQEGKAMNPKGKTQLIPGDAVEAVYPGGGGYGSPGGRAVELVLDDLKNDVISSESAKEIYKLNQM